MAAPQPSLSAEVRCQVIQFNYLNQMDYSNTNESRRSKLPSFFFQKLSSLVFQSVLSVGQNIILFKRLRVVWEWVFFLMV